MRTIENIKSGCNYAAVNVGNIDQIIDHQLPMGPNVIQGKVFVGQAVGATGSVVTKDVPANMVVAGTPAKVIRAIKS